MKKVLSFVLIGAFVLLLIGCGRDTAASNGSASEDVGQSVAGLGEDVSFLSSDGSSVYRIVRPDGDLELNETVKSLIKQMRVVLNTDIYSVYDYESGDGVYEILIGDTNRSETLTAEKLLEEHGGRYNDYIIISIGRKIVIFSKNTDRIPKAVEYFSQTFLQKDVVKNGIAFYCISDESYGSVTVNGIEVGLFDFVRPHCNSSYLTEVKMQEISDRILGITGYNIPITHDTETHETAKYEIIVGNADRDGVEPISDYDKFSIKISGEKVYLNGGSAHATAMAVSEFGKMLEKGNITDADSVINGSYEAAFKNYDKATEYYKTWGDDFDEAELDTSVWVQQGYSVKQPGIGGKTSVRSESPQDVFVSDGKFHICARQDDEYYYGGKILTQGKLAFKYGVLEASMLVPVGKGFWTALWTVSDDTYPNSLDSALPKYIHSEIDIMESFGSASWFSGTFHSTPLSEGEKVGYTKITANIEDCIGDKKRYIDDELGLSEVFRCYGMVWDDKNVTLFCDGKAFLSYNYAKIDMQWMETLHNEMYVIISMATCFERDPYADRIDEMPEQWEKSNKLIVDWVNLYQLQDGKCFLNQFKG